MSLARLLLLAAAAHFTGCTSFWCPPDSLHPITPAPRLNAEPAGPIRLLPHRAVARVTARSSIAAQDSRTRST